MNESGILVLLSLAAAAAYFFSKKGNSGAQSAGFAWDDYFGNEYNYIDDSTFLPGYNYSNDPVFVIDEWLLDPSASFDDNYGYNPYMSPFDSLHPNVAAFLKTIIATEGSANGGRDPFTTVYSYAFEITDFSDHPANLGWKGVKLPDSMCRAAGFNPGCVSTAAGAFQIIKPTWNRLGLPDFSPASQISAAILLLKERGAYADIVAGNIQSAINKAAKEWASLPGSTSGQPQVALSSALSIYESEGGYFA